MGSLNKNQVGLAVGGLLGLVHLVWALLVAVGLAQSLLDFIFGLHFLRNPYTVELFRFGTAILLVIVTAIVGYVFGWLFAMIWNRLHGVKA